MNRAHLFLTLGGLLLASFIACSEPSRQKVADDDDGQGAAAGSGGGLAHQLACSDYINCVASATPGALDAAISAYGAEGTCWQELSEEQCQDACAIAHADLADAHPHVVECAGEATTCTESCSNVSPSASCIASCEEACMAECDADPASFSCENWCANDCTGACPDCVSCDATQCNATCACECGTACAEVVTGADCPTQCGGACTASCTALRSAECLAAS